MTRFFTGLTLLIASGLPLAQSLPKPSAADYFMYVGTYTEKASKGIYGYRFNPAATNGGGLTPLGLVAETPNAAFLAATPDGRFVYAVNWNSCAACTCPIAGTTASRCSPWISTREC